MNEIQDVYVVGRNSILNALLCSAIEKELGFECTASAEMPAIGEVFETWEMRPAILMVDEADAHAVSDLRSFLASRRHRGEGAPVRAALFNVAGSRPALGDAVRAGLRGIFLATDSLPRLLEGVRTLASGDDWLPPGARPEPIRSDIERSAEALLRSGLTMREVEILTALAAGASNRQIAEALFISPHTVKAHLYNMFRKLDVDSRLKAMLWASVNLRGVPTFARARQPSPMDPTAAGAA